MCLASFVKLHNCDVFTFSRDEQSDRIFSPPTKSESGIFAPKDLIGGGTWIGFNGKSVVSLQNGGKIKHKRELPYDLSRGLILTDFLIHEDVNSLKNFLNSHKIEPFTLTIFSIGHLNLIQHIWNGLELNSTEISGRSKWINGSSTLYNPEQIEKIEIDFKNQIFYTPEEIFNFHQNYKIGGDKNPIIRPATTSIIQFILNGAHAICRFNNLVESTDTTYFI